MKSNVFGLLVVVVGIAVFSMSGQSPKQTAKESPSQKGLTRQRQLPIADFSEQEQIGRNVSLKQKVKASRYDKQSSQPIEESSSVVGRIWSSHWSKGIPALPFHQSDVVIIGSVMDAKAYLSNDKTGVFSEFAVQIEEVFQNNSKDSISAGDTFSVERFGGAVRFPSGVIQTYETTGQGMPGVGEHFLFFLKRIDESEFSIVTGYQLNGQIVIPLDGSVVEQGNGAYPFDVYRGVNVSDFLGVIKGQLTQKSVSSL